MYCDASPYYEYSMYSGCVAVGRALASKPTGRGWPTLKRQGSVLKYNKRERERGRDNKRVRSLFEMQQH